MPGVDPLFRSTGSAAGQAALDEQQADRFGLCQGKKCMAIQTESLLLKKFITAVETMLERMLDKRSQVKGVNSKSTAFCYDVCRQHIPNICSA